MSSSKGRSIAAWVLVVALAVMFLLAALGKLTGAATPMFEAWGYPSWFAVLIGAAELAGAIGLLVPRTTRWAAVGLVLVMLGAVFTHVTNGEGAQVLRPLIFLGGLAAVLLLRSGSAGGRSRGSSPLQVS